VPVIAGKFPLGQGQGVATVGLLVTVHAEALMAQAPDLFDASPKIEKVDVLATKLP
jgi:hypothetical protein